MCECYNRQTDCLTLETRARFCMLLQKGSRVKQAATDKIGRTQENRAERTKTFPKRGSQDMQATRCPSGVRFSEPSNTPDRHRECLRESQLSKSKRFKCSFVPCAITLLSLNRKRKSQVKLRQCFLVYHRCVFVYLVCDGNLNKLPPRGDNKILSSKKQTKVLLKVLLRSTIMQNVKNNICKSKK